MKSVMNYSIKREIEQVPCFIERDTQGMMRYTIIIRKEGEKDIRVPITCWNDSNWSDAFRAYNKQVKGGNIGKVQQIEKKCSKCGAENHDSEDHKRIWGND